MCVPVQVVGAKYNGQGPSIPRTCPLAIGSFMESCWSNLPADRPSFEKICETLEGICASLDNGNSNSRKLAPAAGNPNYFEGAMSVP